MHQHLGKRKYNYEINCESICWINDGSREKNDGDSQNMRDAKTVGFSIGTDDVEQSKGGVSKKLAIFDIDMQQYYDYVVEPSFH